jgi:hypothetical protein
VPPCLAAFLLSKNAVNRSFGTSTVMLSLFLLPVNSSSNRDRNQYREQGLLLTFP